MKTFNRDVFKVLNSNFKNARVFKRDFRTQLMVFIEESHLKHILETMQISQTQKKTMQINQIQK